MNNKLKNMTNQTVRLFIAVDMPQEVRQEIGRIQNYFKKRNLFNGKYTDAQHVHITLKFLGEVDSAMLPVIQEALGSIVFQSMPAHVGTVDVFASGNRIRVLFLYIICPTLTQLAKQVDTALSQWFEPEQRPFVSHVTIARVKAVDDRSKLINAVNVFSVSPIQFTINEFVLKQSVLLPAGPMYTDIERYTVNKISTA